MKKIVYLASLCAALLVSGCYENTYQNKKDNGGSTTTTTTTTTDTNGNTTTTTTTTTTDSKNSFHSQNGKFSIDFQHAPVGPISKEVTNKAGMVQVIQYIDQVSDNSMYIAMYKDYPVGVVTADNVESKLKAESESFMGGLNAKVAKTQEERLNGNKGLSFSGPINDTIAVSMRSYFVGKRYYMFGTISTNKEITDKASKSFITSFELDN